MKNRWPGLRSLAIFLEMKLGNLSAAASTSCSPAGIFSGSLPSLKVSSFSGFLLAVNGEKIVSKYMSVRIEGFSLKFSLIKYQNSYRVFFSRELIICETAFFQLPFANLFRSGFVQCCLYTFFLALYIYYLTSKVCILFMFDCLVA